MYLLRLILGFTLLLTGFDAAGQQKIQVLDTDSKLPIQGASVFLVPLDTLLITDKNGETEIPYQLINKIQFAEIRSIGHESEIIYPEDLEEKHLNVITIYATPIAQQLQEILVLEDQVRDTRSLSSTLLTDKYFSRNNAGTISQSLRKVPGMQSLDMGPGVGKPVIRGLFGNRILVNKDYIKQEGQQWGTDHGLEIDPFDARRIEIIKGPASLQYGSDGLGGVLNILPNNLPKEDYLESQFTSLYKSNNNHRAASLYVATKKDKWFITTRASIQQFDDFRVPAESFTYNSFELPIFNQQLKNTAGFERSLSTTVGFQNEKQLTKLLYSVYDLKVGIFSGAVGIPRSYILADDGLPGNIEVPFQEVNHQRLVLNHISFLGKDNFTINLGYQQNFRTEHSIPESHSQFDIDPNETRAVILNLKTYTYESHYELNHVGSGRSVFGSNGQFQTNERGGFEFLLPDFQLWRVGLFYFVEQPVAQEWTISAGARYDIGNNQTTDFILERRNRQGNIFAITSVEALDDTFHNWSGSIGLYYKNKSPYTVRLNIGKSFRIPYPNETSSNGIHHGNFRHEMGNPNLTSEHGYQADLSLSFEGNKFYAQISPFFNFFDGYIYLSPSANFSRLPEAGLVFNYLQSDAIYTGFEAEYEFEIIKSLNWRQSIEYVHSFNMQSQFALPFTPPISILTELSHQVTLPRFNLEGILSSHYFFRNGINRVDRFEQPTPGYHLVDLLLQLSFTKWVEGTVIQFQIDNLFNLPYLNHMSRYRLLNLPEQGRNLILTLRIPLTIKIFS